MPERDMATYRPTAVDARRGSGSAEAPGGDPIRLLAIDEHLDEVLRLSVLLTHSVYDCAYLALALLNRTRVVTADRRFAKAVRSEAALAGSVMLLRETAH
jgi:hypothetical protein